MLQYFLGEFSFESLRSVSLELCSNEKANMIVTLLMNFELHSSVSTVDMLFVKYCRVSVVL
jgi:hypothetical protein